MIAYYPEKGRHIIIFIIEGPAFVDRVKLKQFFDMLGYQFNKLDFLGYSKKITSTLSTDPKFWVGPENNLGKF